MGYKKGDQVLCRLTSQGITVGWGDVNILEYVYRIQFTKDAAKRHNLYDGDGEPVAITVSGVDLKPLSERVTLDSLEHDEDGKHRTPIQIHLSNCQRKKLRINSRWHSQLRKTRTTSPKMKRMSKSFQHPRRSDLHKRISRNVELWGFSQSRSMD